MWINARVRDVVVREVVSVDVDASVEKAAKLMVENDIGGLLVTEKGKPVGVVTERDMLKKVTARGLSPGSVKVRDIMSSPLITIDANATLEEAAELMSRKKIRRLIATEAGKVIGIFTQRDILALHRICGYCSKAIRPRLPSRPQEEADMYVECSCGARYHIDCAKVVVYCVFCSSKLVTEVIYPEPSETMGG
ncbi:MAG: CBS domain-containing protein [Aigarchaeota archaeon]|nr:CBS domain-containing protein [Candidatus Pelearchaeum maunauluense]